MRPALLLAAALGLTSSARADFFTEQRRAPRVKAAYAARGEELRGLFTSREVPYPPRGVLIRVFKEEEELELWGARADGTYALLKRFPVCASSGELGPKRREGDLQVPEGFYALNLFNPASRFHLSLGVSYPNAADRILAGKGPLGGEIFIHGACATIGCVPIEDGPIELVYLAALEARAAGQEEIPIHIFPARLTDAALARLSRARAGDPTTVAFWRNLKQGFETFEKEKRLPRVRVDRNGQYLFSSPH
jgi:murein L,D-transpeptidase YafK